MSSKTETAPEFSAEDRAVEARMRQISRRSFLWAAGVTLSGFAGLYEFNKRASESDGIKTPLRRGLNLTDKVAASLFFSPTHLAREFPKSFAVEPKNNYKGDTPIVDLAAWRLDVPNSTVGPKKIKISDIKKLPFVEQTTELKCVEGWSVIVTWAGARFLDFAKAFPPPPGTKYVSFLSEPADFPDERYYVGIDIASAMHPQTLLAYEMNGVPLGAPHGAPLRLTIPTKYGIKNIKLITSIAYSETRPKDYWFEQGYDYFAGL